MVKKSEPINKQPNTSVIMVFGKFQLNLNNSVQLSQKGRPFRLSSTESIGNEVWVDRVKKTGTRHTFRYLDVPNEFVGFEFDVYGAFVRKV